MQGSTGIWGKNDWMHVTVDGHGRRLLVDQMCIIMRHASACGHDPSRSLRLSAVKMLRVLVAVVFAFAGSEVDLSNHFMNDCSRLSHQHMISRKWRAYEDEEDEKSAANDLPEGTPVLAKIKDSGKLSSAKAFRSDRRRSLRCLNLARSGRPDCFLCNRNSLLVAERQVRNQHLPLIMFGAAVRQA